MLKAARVSLSSLLVGCSLFAFSAALPLAAATLTIEDTEDAPSLESFEGDGAGSPSGVLDLPESWMDEVDGGGVALGQSKAALRAAIGALSSQGGEENLARLQHLMKAHPDDVNARLFLVVWASDNGKLDLAEQTMLEAKDLAGDYPLMKLAEAALLIAKGRTDDALPKLEAAMREAPGSVGVASRLSDIYLQRGRVLDAVSTLEALVEARGFSRATASSVSKLAQLLLDTGVYDRAYTHASALLRMKGTTPEQTAPYAVLAAQAAFANGDLTSAQEVLRLQQSEWFGWVNSAVVVQAALEWLKGQTEQAEKQLDILRPDAQAGPLATRYLAQIAFSKGQAVQGSRLYEEAVDRAAPLERMTVLREYVVALDTEGLNATRMRPSEPDCRNLAFSGLSC